MSIQTELNRKVDFAKESIKGAIDQLISATKENTWGVEEADPTYIDLILESIIELRKIERKL